MPGGTASPASYQACPGPGAWTALQTHCNPKDTFLHWIPTDPLLWLSVPSVHLYVCPLSNTHTTEYLGMRVPQGRPHRREVPALAAGHKDLGKAAQPQAVARRALAGSEGGAQSGPLSSGS